MNKIYVLKSIIKVSASRMVSLVSGIVVNLLLPVILTVEGYGNLKIYTLYITYTSLLHFGFADGILLKFAGLKYEEIEKEKLRTFTKFFILFQSLIGIIVFFVGFIFTNPDHKFITHMLGINLVLINLTTYYQFISQATHRFEEYSARNFLIAILKTGFVLILLAYSNISLANITYKVYIYGLNAIDFFLLSWYVVTYRDITLKKGVPIKRSIPEIKLLFKEGIYLTIAYQVYHLILALDRQFVSMLFHTETYAYYSFAYSILSMLSTIISSIAIVIFPFLKQISKDKTKAFYNIMLSLIAILAGIGIMGYYPLIFIIQYALPKYTNSIIYLKIILPTLIFTSGISIVMFTYCKVLDMNIQFFNMGCKMLITGFGLNLISYFIFKTPESISYASLITMIIWYMVEGAEIGKVLDKNISNTTIYIISVVGSFFMVNGILDTILCSGIAYMILYVFITTVFVKKTKFIQELKNLDI